MPPLALDDDAMDAIMAAAKPLAVLDRDEFVRAVAFELARNPDSVGPGSVHRAIRSVQKKFFDPPKVPWNGRLDRAI
jgi:hypothetical protein